MKKLPLLFCLLTSACAAPKQVVSNTPAFNKHPEPYHIYAIGKWDSDYVILTLTDSRSDYFSVKTNYSATLKKGDVYKPAVIVN